MCREDMGALQGACCNGVGRMTAVAVDIGIPSPRKSPEAVVHPRSGENGEASPRPKSKWLKEAIRLLMDALDVTGPQALALLRAQQADRADEARAFVLRHFRVDVARRGDLIVIEPTYRQLAASKTNWRYRS